MIEEFECPNCGSADTEVLSEGMHKCNYCSTSFKDEVSLQRKHEREKLAMKHEADTARHQTHTVQAAVASGKKMTGRILLFVGIFIVIVFAFVWIMAEKSMEHQQNMQQNIFDQTNELQKSIQEQVDKAFEE